MKISIVVPAFNEEKLLGDSLRSMRRATSAFSDIGWDTELIVCDNNSTDRTAEIARAAGALVVFEPINQIGRARNRGAAAATGDWLVFVDADSHPSHELLATVGKAIRRGDVLAGGSTVKLDGQYPILGLLTKAWNLLSRFKRWAPGSFMFCERETFNRVGGFSHELYASEEVDLFVRLNREARKRGKRIVILKSAPLLTSARKIHLYSWREHLGFLAKLILKPRRTLRDPSKCHTWYDGRR